MLLRMVGARRPGTGHRHRERSRPVDDLPRPERGGEHRLVAWCLAALFCAGAALGSINLLVDGALRDSVSRPLYAGALGACLLIALALVVRQRAGETLTAVLVLLGDATYVLLAWATGDPLRHAPPLMLLFCCFMAAWFLGARALAAHMLAVVAACWVALAGSYPGTPSLLVHVAVSALTLDVATLGVFLLRRRVQRLLAVTQEMSSTDPLTGLANRRSLVDQAPRIWRQARRDGLRVGALVLDLDHFKRLNDEFGHAVGDAVLRGVGSALAASVRPPDVLARTGGEELVVLGLVADPSEARRLAERLRLAVKGSVVGQHQVTVSIGVALTGPADGEDPTDALWRLVDRADAAMYQAKQGGRDRVVVAGGTVVPFRRIGSSHPTAGGMA
ncbi:diguanylate cyclase [uncultured Modestobacter sp.]|uniref:GGDEF domain-containing protein n=1 Tax=uncultured Modestobacter sp. TaxID=380048 RepID=UPI0026357B9A|nr:GGDEF domain-containing protein [uncultured Modestobacter sp.]